MLGVERQMASSTPYDNEEEIALQQDYDHLKLHHAIALRAYESFDPEAVSPAATLKEADEALVTFEAAFPEAVLASVNLNSEDPPATEPASTIDMNTSPVETKTSTQVVLTEPLPISESPTIPNGQPQQSHPESLSSVDTPSPQVLVLSCRVSWFVLVCCPACLSVILLVSTRFRRLSVRVWCPSRVLSCTCCMVSVYHLRRVACGLSFTHNDTLATNLLVHGCGKSCSAIHFRRLVCV